MPLSSAVTSPAAPLTALPAVRESRADLANRAVRKDAYVNCLRDTNRIWGDTKGNQPYSRP
jgi:hypothetical protein